MITVDRIDAWYEKTAVHLLTTVPYLGRISVSGTNPVWYMHKDPALNIRFLVKTPIREFVSLYWARYRK